MSTIEIEKSYQSRVNPQKFALWTAFASIIMMFAAFTSAYLVKQASGNWLEFQIPNIFFLSTGMLLISSYTIHASYNAYKKGIEKKYKLLLVITAILGTAFVAFQYMGWMELFGIGVDLKGNVSGSFFYLISGIHAVHILGGLGVILIALLQAFGTKFEVTQKRKNGFELIVHYWHFVDILWIYLLGFLILSK